MDRFPIDFKTLLSLDVALETYTVFLLYLIKKGIRNFCILFCSDTNSLRQMLQNPKDNIENTHRNAFRKTTLCSQNIKFYPIDLKDAYLQFASLP